MGALQRLIGQLLVRLRDTNSSQRIALLLGGALIAVSLIWLVQWAATPEMVPLLDQDLRPEELTQIRGGLELLGEKFDLRGNRIYVSSAANRQSLLARLQQDEKLPANTTVGFAALVRESDPWVSQAENDRRWTLALQKELEQVLRQFQGVQSASVFLNLNTGRKGFTKLPPANSASVTLVMRHSDQVPRALALAAARMVSGAVAGLRVEDVQVVDAAGTVALDWETEHDPTNALNRLRFKLEQHYMEMIRRQIPDPKALVSVQVELNATASNTRTETPVSGVPKTDESTSDETTRTARSEQPGVQPNVGLAAGAGGSDERRTQETTKTEFDTGRESKTEATPAGEIRLVTAAISLSSSYLEGVYLRANPDAQAPGDAQLEDVFVRERGRLIGQVARLVKPQVEENVAISRYYDSPAEPVPDESIDVVGKSLDFVQEYGAQSALGVLALISLGMMVRMAKRSDAGEAFGLELGLPKEAIEAARLAAADVATVAGPRGGGARGPVRGRGRQMTTVGGRVVESPTTVDVEQAAATEGMLVAQEVDPTTVQTRKMLEQVSEMVDGDPEAVSTLMEQWVQRNEGYHEGDT